MPEFVRLERRDALAEIVLNRADKRNAIHLTMLRELGAAIDETERMSGARAVLVRGEGNGFSAGIDLTAFMQMADVYGENWRDNLFPITQEFQNILNKLERCTLPTIALLHGFCLGLGFELALACDFRIAASGTKLGLPEVKLGIIPDVGGTARLTRLAGIGRAKELVMTGRTFDPEYAERWGIVNSVVPPEALLTAGEALAAELSAAAPLAVQYAKRVINDLADLQRGLQLEAWAQSQLFRSHDFEVGAQAMLTRQTPEWTGR
jgi:enoyl-CoA hydratase/carnithine racemase